MKLWITVEQECLTLTRSLLVCIGLLDCNGELACNAKFLCSEAPLCAEILHPDSAHSEQSYID